MSYFENIYSCFEKCCFFPILLQEKKNGNLFYVEKIMEKKKGSPKERRPLVTMMGIHWRIVMFPQNHPWSNAGVYHQKSTFPWWNLLFGKKKKKETQENIIHGRKIQGIFLISWGQVVVSPSKYAWSGKYHVSLNDINGPIIPHRNHHEHGGGVGPPLQSHAIPPHCSSSVTSYEQGRNVDP